MNVIVFVATLTSIAVLQLEHAQPEIHLVPAEYSGWVAIAFRAVNGEAPVYESNARLYRIPQRGVLLTQAELNRGTSPAWKFFFESADGTRTPIQLVSAGPVRDTPDNRADPTIGVFGIGRGGTPAGKERCQVDFDIYFIGTRAQFLTQIGNRFQRIGRVLATEYVCP